MPRVKLAVFLGSLLLLQMATIEAQKINLIKVNNCLQVGMELTGAVARKLVPLIKELIACVGFKYEVNSESLKTTQLLVLVYQFIMYAINQKTICVLNLYSTLTATTTPYTDKLSSLKCAYILAPEPLC